MKPERPQLTGELPRAKLAWNTLVAFAGAMKMDAAVRRAVSKSKGYFLAPLVIFFACNSPSAEVTITQANDTRVARGSGVPDASVQGAAKAPGIEAPDLNLPISENVTPSAEPTESPAQPGVCPSGMILVDGDFCPNAEQTCLDWKDDPAKYQYARCARYSEQSICKAERVPLRFCIDRYEAADDEGLPIGDTSWTAASAACKSKGKRLCKEHEWLFACEGEEMRPYPYGYVRSPQLCNFEITEGLATRTGDLADHRQPVTANPECRSPFGVINMVGNIDEWVELDKPYYSAANGGRKMMSGLKGGWWGPLRNRCRPTTVDHDEFFHELQTGFRCCADAS